MSYCRTLKAQFAATADNAAEITCLKPGRIKGIQFVTKGDLDADAENYTVEVSKKPFMQGETNDSDNVLCIQSGYAYLLTSGFGDNARNIYCPMDVPWATGEKLYLNGVLTGTTGVTAIAIIHIV